VKFPYPACEFEKILDNLFTNFLKINNTLLIKMLLVAEALFVALYSLVLFSIIKFTGLNVSTCVFITGFLKHFLGYFLGIHGLYCNKYNLKADSLKLHQLFVESVLEGLAFIFLFTFKYVKDLNLSILLLGFSLHILSELSGIHRYFLSYRCR